LSILVALMLAGCSPRFPLSGHEFDGRVKRAHLGSSFSALSEELSESGFRAEGSGYSLVPGSRRFYFTSLQGALQCGQLIQGEYDITSRTITRIEASQGWFSALTP
jgi:hypothetical protein